MLRAGERAEWCFLLTSGLVRELYISDSGEEHTRSFLCERQMTGSLLDLMSGQPSITWIQVLEPTSCLALRFRDIEQLTGSFPELHVLFRRHAEALYVLKTRREYEMLALPAAERYARWLERSRELDQRISGKYLASYLGITPEHLSRLRRARVDAGRRPRRPARARPGST